MTDARILIAEDKPDMRKFYRVTFPDIAFDFAGDGHELVMLARLKPYALLWVDLTMPFMSGCEAVTVIRNEDGPNRNACICAVSGDPAQDVQKQEGSCHFDWAFQKPVDYSAMSLWFHNAIAIERPI